MTNFPLYACFSVAMAAAPGAPSTWLPESLPTTAAAGDKPAATKVQVKSPSTAKKDADDADTWAVKVQKAYDAVKDYQASFEQVTLLGGKNPGPKASGTVALAKPGKLRWEFKEPADERKVIVSDGETLWMHDIPENQVIVDENMKQTTSLTALNFLEGLGSLRKSFDVSVVAPRKTATHPGSVFLRLVPKEDADVQVAEIVLSIDRKTSLANEAFLIDAMGNETRLTFKAPKVNTGIPAKTFRLEIPPNAEVIKPALLQ